MHEHTTHVHQLKYCSVCDTVYCPPCGREWRAQVTYVWGDSISTGTAYPRPYGNYTITATNTFSTASASSITDLDCSHD